MPPGGMYLRLRSELWRRRSEPHTPAWAIRMRIAPGSGSGTGYSRISNGAFGLVRTTARPFSTSASYELLALSAVADVLVCGAPQRWMQFGAARDVWPCWRPRSSHRGDWCEGFGTR